jgi:hypothetical protein
MDFNWPMFGLSSLSGLGVVALLYVAVWSQRAISSNTINKLIIFFVAWVACAGACAAGYFTPSMMNWMIIGTAIGVGVVLLSVLFGRNKKGK